MNKKTSADVVVGAKFGRWTVLEVNLRNPNSKAKYKPRVALCRCECGTERYKEYRDLYSGRSLSCGCLANELTVIRNTERSSVKVGNRYGKLIVVEDLGFRQQKRGKQEKWYKCNCDCGNSCEVNGNNLQTGRTKSCGCTSSHGESLISQILLQNNINFIKEYTFSDLKYINLLRFDFAILDDNNNIQFLIEFDGRQHYLGPDGTWKNSYTLEEIQYRDNLKNEYCKNHNIILKRIPYFDLNKITFDTLFDDTFTVLFDDKDHD